MANSILGGPLRDRTKQAINRLMAEYGNRTGDDLLGAVAQKTAVDAMCHCFP